MTYTPSSLIGKAGLLFAQNERRMPGIDCVSFQFWSQNKTKGEFKMSKEIYENAMTAAKAFCKAEAQPPTLYIEKSKLIEAFANADTDISADYGPDYGSESGYSRDKVAEIIESVPAAPSEIPCRCWQCDHFSRENPGHKPHLDGGYCYFWDYETGMAPNWVDNFGFCSNGSPDKDAVLPKEVNYPRL